MLCFLDGCSFERTLLTFREIGTGRVPRQMLSDVTLVFGRDEFIELLAPTYAAFGKELKEDIQLVGDADSDELACVTHATLAELINRAPVALPGLMRDYLWNDLLRLCFEVNPIERCEYVLDAFESLELGPSSITIASTAYHIRPFQTGKAG